MELFRFNKQNPIYSDLDLLFKIHPVTNDLSVVKDLDAIFKSIRNLLLTNHYERPFHPEKGSNIRKMLFENIDRLSSNYIEREIFNVLSNFEPRIKLESINVWDDRDNNAVIAEISFYLINSTELTTVQIPFAR